MLIAVHVVERDASIKLLTSTEPSAWRRLLNDNHQSPHLPILWAPIDGVDGSPKRCWLLCGSVKEEEWGVR